MKFWKNEYYKNHLFLRFLIYIFLITNKKTFSILKKIYIIEKKIYGYKDTRLN